MVATIILVAIFTVLVGAALGVSQSLLSGAYTRSDSSEAASVCGALAAAASSTGFTYGEAQSVGYTFRSSSIAFIPGVLSYTVEFPGGGPIVLSTGIVVVGTPDAGYFGPRYTTIYPSGSHYPTAPSVGVGGSVAWAAQQVWSEGSAEYVFTYVYTLPRLVDTGLSVGGEEVWRLYFISLVGGGGGVESFTKAGYIELSALGGQVYTYSGVEELSVTYTSSSAAYPAGFFNISTTTFNFESPVVLQVVVAQVAVSGG